MPGAHCCPITGAVTLDGGTIAPGNSPGMLSITGDYTQTAAGSFAAEIGGLLQGIEYDFLNVSGIATLDGLLDITLFDDGKGDFKPKRGDSFDILSAEDIVGTFGSYSFAPLKKNLQWEVSYLTDVTARLMSSDSESLPLPNLKSTR